MSGREIEIQTPNLTLKALIWGPDDGIPVLAIHGWLDNAASFSIVSEFLPGIRLVALDLPGHGHSDHRPRGASYHVVDYAVDIVASANALGWQRFALLGHSMGAALSTLVASIIPERITALALIDNLGPRSSIVDEGPINLEYAVSHVLKTSERKLTIYKSVEDAAQVRFDSKEIPEPLRLSLSSALVLTERGVNHVESGVAWSSDPRLRIGSLYFLTQDQVLAFLKKISSPTLLVRASHGVLWSRSYMPQRYGVVQNLTIVDVDGPHHVHMENAEEVARHVWSFLANHR